MSEAVEDTVPSGDGGLLAEVSNLDRNLYAAVATSDTPTIDSLLRGLSRTADKSVLWLTIAGALALAGGPQGRRAALAGVASIGAASAAVNLGVKPLAHRRRPDRTGAGVIEGRHVRMPGSTSFPSGHSASAFAFAEGVGSVIPWLAPPLHVAAATVAYSRVHTGVHYPGDVIVGSLIGMTSGEIVSSVAAKFFRRRTLASAIHGPA